LPELMANLGNGMRLEPFVTIFNLFNQQPETQVDGTCTYEFVNPIVGGSVEDLAHLKVLSDKPSPVTAEVNPNYENTSVRQAPASARFGLRFLF
jgi:hypothetical protein